ncbi:MAG: Gfo/Idh/MocA family oxidoreductase [Planctomycetaceae bacterium]
MTATRREFLQRSIAAGAAFPLPFLWTKRSSAAGDANGRLTMAAIGVGGSRGAYSQGGAIARRAAQHAEMIAVCDVDDRHTAEFNAHFDGQLATYRDYRVLFEKHRPDVVTIGTPDHWHVPIASAALRAGSDVYCEKPLTLTIDEGIAIRKVVEETGRVFQVGTQQRSQDALRFLKAIAIVRSGRLGKNVNAYVAIGGGPTGGPFDGEASPDDLDWDMWLGGAPQAEFASLRRKEFRWFFEYSGGKMTDWGAHHIDIAQWALGCDHTGPVKVSGNGQFPPLVPDTFDWKAFLDGEAVLPSGYNTATRFSVDLKFANGATINVNHHYRRDDGTDFDNGILFEGDDGRIFVNRGRLSGQPIDDLTEADETELADRMAKLYKDKRPGDHMRNFFECVKDRTQPISDVATHHRTMTSCHLANIALMLGRDLAWDPEKETFVGDDQAQALASRKRREKYAVGG